MKLQDYKELMTRAFSRNTRRGYADMQLDIFKMEQNRQR